jgi:hypothetical protein
MTDTRTTNPVNDPLCGFCGAYMSVLFQSRKTGLPAATIATITASARHPAETAAL